ncbi:MAG: arylesterase [Flavobacteriales bacterium]|nr:arylesterase [Flavobacteriales bacterium]
MHRNESYSPPAVVKLIACVLILTLFGCGDPVKPAEVQSQPPEKEQLKIKEKVILCFGNSLTEGYGLKPEESYPSLLQNRIDSLGLNYRVVNAGISGETTAGGKSRLGWVLKNKVDIFVLELGANDGLRGIPIEETKRNLQSIIDTVQVKIPGVKIILAGMQIPPNLGEKYTQEFQAIFPTLAEENSVHLIPFLLRGVAGETELNQEDGIHPTAEGTLQVMENIWKVMEPFL